MNSTTGSNVPKYSDVVHRHGKVQYNIKDRIFQLHKHEVENFAWYEEVRRLHKLRTIVTPDLELTRSSYFSPCPILRTVLKTWKIRNLLSGTKTYDLNVSVSRI